ncbi:MAG: hypothetical protein ACR2P6_07420 [Gammaproteobacteria bacterium]
MSTEIIFVFAMLVFFLMIIGLFLTMIQFNKMTDDPSVRKGPGNETDADNRAVSASQPDSA